MSDWIAPKPHDDRRSVDLVRVALAVILVTHPLHALFHPADAAELARALEARGLPWGTALAWAALALEFASSIALVVPRLIAAGALGSILVVAGGAGVLYAPRWFAVGIGDDAPPGVEFNALLTACLCGVLWTYWPRRGGAAPAGPDASPGAARGGLEIIRVASAVSLLAHGWGAFVEWDFHGMREWGEAMSRHGYPFGLALVWSIKSVELVSGIGRLVRRLIVPACFGHLSYLIPALWVHHRMRWFVVGPGREGIEFPLLIIVCTVACILAYWPKRRALELAGAVSLP